MFHKKVSIFLMTAFLLTSFSVSGFAGQYDIKQMTPQIQQALSNRQARYEELSRLKSSGALGEDNQGLVVALQSEASSVAAAENSDREVIYHAIVEQNGLGPAGLSQVKSVFADVQREKAKSGESIQLPSGEWTKK